MELLIRIVCILVGLWFIVAVIRSCSKVALVNISAPDPLTSTVSRLLYSMMSAVILRQRTYRSRQKILAWFGPLFLFASIFCYFLFTMIGFALIYRAVNAEPTFFQSLIASGSALSTLGFHTPASQAGEVISIIEGAVGLGVVVFLITFVPGYQAAVQEREELSAKLYARTGETPNCEAIYTWNAVANRRKSMEDFWDLWEDFLRSLGDIHAESPILIFTPSIRIGQSWIVSVFAVMDAANLAATTIRNQGRPYAETCMHEGAKSLKRMAATFQMLQDFEARSPLTRSAFDHLCERLATSGYELEEDREKAWMGFACNRSQYERILIFLAESLFVALRTQLTQLDPPDSDKIVVSNIRLTEEERNETI